MRSKVCKPKASEGYIKYLETDYRSGCVVCSADVLV